MIDWEALKLQNSKNPKKLMYSVLLLSAVFFAIWLLAISNTQDKPTYVSIEPLSSAKDTASQALLSKPDSGIVKKLEFTKSGKPVQKAQNNHSLWISFAFFAVLLFAFVVWIKKKNNHPQQDSVIQIVSSQSLDAGHKISVVKINGEYLVLGNSSAGIQLLQTYSSDKWLSKHKTGTDEIKKTGFLKMLNEHKKMMN